MMYLIKKKLNNNVVLVGDNKGNDLILVGNGIGFDAVVKGVFCRFERVTQTFVLSKENIKEGFREIVETSDPELVAFLEEVIDDIQHNLNTKLNENIHVTLIDHVVFAIERQEMGMDFHNPMNADISFIYKKEYEQAKLLVDRLEQKFGVKLIDDEVGILAIHIHAASHNESINSSREKIELIQKTISALYEEFNIEMNTSSLYHQRLLVHVRYAFERIFSNQPIEIEIIHIIRANYDSEFRRIEKAMKEVTKEFGIEVPSSEIGYLVLHSLRIMKENSNKCDLDQR